MLRAWLTCRQDVANDMREICLERDKLRARLEQAEDLRDKYFDDLKRSRANMREIQTKIVRRDTCSVMKFVFDEIISSLRICFVWFWLMQITLW